MRKLIPENFTRMDKLLAKIQKNLERNDPPTYQCIACADTGFTTGSRRAFNRDYLTAKGCNECLKGFHIRQGGQEMF